MYMEPIVRAPTTMREPSPVLLGLVGMPVLLLTGLVMLPWLAIQALVAAMVLGARIVMGLPRTLVQMIGYAGRVALGRY